MNLIESDARYKEVERFVRTSLSGFDGGHDWMHILRVLNTSLYIYEHEEGADLDIVVLGALLHDIDDRKFSDSDPKQKITSLLGILGFDQYHIDSVIDINRNISFSSSDKIIHKSLELMIVQDADRLDAIGAIGIARAFNYGGFKNRKIYDPDYKIAQAGDMEAYRSSASPTINHFYEKLLLLKGLMNTPTARKLAEERHRFMEMYLEQFYREWDIGK